MRTPRTKLLGAVSVTRRNSDGSWHGDTMDGAAFVKGSKTPALTLKERERFWWARARRAARLLWRCSSQEFGNSSSTTPVPGASINQLIEIVSKIARGRVVSGPPDPTGCDMVSNATPMGMSPDDPLPVAAHLLNSSMFVGDVVAGHGTTPLLKAAKAAGCRTADGAQMVEAVQEMMLDFLLFSDANPSLFGL